MGFASFKSNDRLVGAIGAVLVQGALLYALLVGLAVHLSNGPDEKLSVFAVTPPPPPPPRERTVPHRIRSRHREGAASPPTLRAKRTEVVAPPPVVELPVPSPVVTAPVAGIGSADHAGASTVPGPGSGSGGVGNGTGSGDEGDGDGDGGDYLAPVQRRGSLRISDLPRSVDEAGVGGTVGVRYRVETDGRVTHCSVTRSSGNADLDDTTCRLIERRFRFVPSTDPRGRPVPSYIVQNHSWEIDRVRSDEGD